MKTSLLLAAVVLLTSSASFAQYRVPSCKGKAIRAAISFATQTEGRKNVRHEISDLSSETGQGKSKTTVYSVGLEQCDNGGCGSLSYDVVLRGEMPNCRVVRVELTSEE